MSISSDIREYALSLGYDRVGFTTAERFTLLEQALSERPQMYSWAMDGSLQLLKSADPGNIMPGARSIVVTVYDYSKQSYPKALAGKIGRVYLAYGAGALHAVHRARHSLLREFLVKLGARVARGSISPPARLAGARAGVTDFGKNCFAFARDIGSFIVINTLVTDIDLQYDEPALEVGCPDKCTLCLDTCPTGALYQPLRMNPLRCVAYNSYATPGTVFGNVSDILSPEIREGMGSWVYGCDICQEVCPRNQPRLKARLPSNAYLEHIAGDFALDRLLNMSDEHFRGRVLPLLQYIGDRRYFQRNAAVALGNLRNEDAIPAITQAIQGPDALVRGHAAWALGKIGTGKARVILNRCLLREGSSFVRDEIRAALAR
ncbi:MAG: epoxyqueuosine reductase [Dehalococcoidia bacterium]|nr:epoxyqueuosine reductase [Dehalococcoidia bacterium]